MSSHDFRVMCAALLEEIPHEWPATYLIRAVTNATSKAFEPVPVHERPWEWEGWIDSEGGCWWGVPGDDLVNHAWNFGTWSEVQEYCEHEMPQVSLPHWALPVPTASRVEVKP